MSAESHKNPGSQGNSDFVPENDRLLRVPDVCRLTSVSRSTVYRMVEQNKLPHIWVGGSLRFRHSSILHWLAEQEQLPIPADFGTDNAR